MFLTYFRAPGKSFTVSLISASYLMHLFSRRDLDSHVASKSVLFKAIFTVMQHRVSQKKYARLMSH